MYKRKPGENLHSVEAPLLVSVIVKDFFKCFLLRQNHSLDLDLGFNDVLFFHGGFLSPLFH